MTTLKVTARFKIHGGKLAEFEVAAAACLESVKKNDTGTLEYDWFLADDESECVVRETYKDSNAVFEHMGNLGDKLGALLATADMELEVCGSPSPELVEATKEMAVKIYSPFQGL